MADLVVVYRIEGEIRMLWRFVDHDDFVSFDDWMARNVTFIHHGCRPTLYQQHLYAHYNGLDREEREFVMTVWDAGDP